MTREDFARGLYILRHAYCRSVWRPHRATALSAIALHSRRIGDDTIIRRDTHKLLPERTGRHRQVTQALHGGSTRPGDVLSGCKSHLDKAGPGRPYSGRGPGPDDIHGRRSHSHTPATMALVRATLSPTSAARPPLPARLASRAWLYVNSRQQKVKTVKFLQTT